MIDARTSKASPHGRATGFELAGGDGPGPTGWQPALGRNRAFAAAGGHTGAVVFPRLRLRPR